MNEKLVEEPKVKELEIDDDGYIWIKGRRTGQPLAQIQFDGIGVAPEINKKFILDKLNAVDPKVTEQRCRELEEAIDLLVDCAHYSKGWAPYILR